MDKLIRYYSTGSGVNGTSSRLSFRDAFLQGLAPDGGLFLPDRIPELSSDELQAMQGEPYRKVALAVLGKYLLPEMDRSILQDIVDQSYDFDIPVEAIGTDTFLVRLDRGPTASFKDFAAAFMARTMYHLKPADLEITVLVATSGDTGSAVGEAYRGLDGFRVVILYPKDEVSSIQKKHLDSIGENVRTVAVDGKFDQCQELVKEAFVDPDLKGLNLTSANSINIGRLLPQIVYYVYSYLKVAEPSEPVVFSIPSGNFGNSLGCEMARRMGLPIDRMLVAVNENDEFPLFLETGDYRKIEPSRVCLSNAMNVGNPSNLARYFDLFGGRLTRTGEVVQMPDLEEMRRHIYSTSVNDQTTADVIREMHKRDGILVEPHGAVGIEALRRFREAGAKGKALSIETAHPGKFPDEIAGILDIPVPPPAAFRKFTNRESCVRQLRCDYHSFKEYLKEND